MPKSSFLLLFPLNLKVSVFSFRYGFFLARFFFFFTEEIQVLLFNFKILLAVFLVNFDSHILKLCSHEPWTSTYSWTSHDGGNKHQLIQTAFQFLING